MNPSIVFQHLGHALVVRVKPESVAQYTESPKAFKTLVEALAEHTGYDTDNRMHQSLPIGNELSGRWIGSSPLGQEFQCPPIAWMFEERVKNAMSLETHPLVVMPQLIDYEEMKQLRMLEITDAAKAKLGLIDAKLFVEAILGEGSVVETQAQRVRSALDDALDNMCTG